MFKQRHQRLFTIRWQDRLIARIGDRPTAYSVFWFVILLTLAHTLILWITPVRAQTVAVTTAGVHSLSREDPLLEAIGYNDVAGVKIVLRQGRSANQVMKQGSYLPLHWASALGYTTIAATLIQSGAQIEATQPEFGQRTPLFAAVENGQLETTEFLLSLGANAKAVRIDGANLLHAAIQSRENSLELVKALMKSGANPKSLHNGIDLVQAAVIHGQPATLRHLLELGLPADRVNPAQGTALHMAVKSQNLESVLLLLLRGANPNRADPIFRLRPLQLAQEDQNQKLIEVLRVAGAR